MYNGMMIKNTANTNNTTTTNNNNKKENNEMNELKMINILSKLDAQGIEIGFEDQVPVSLAFGDWVPASLAHKFKPYATGFMTGEISSNMIQKMFPSKTVPGIGLTIKGPDETMSPELIELTSYLSQKPQEAVSLIRFCMKCLAAGNKPIRILEDGEEKYFLCSNGKVLVRNGDEFTVYYEGTELPNMDGMSDRQRISILHATKETYNNLTEKDYEEEEEYEEEEDYEEEEEDFSDILITTARQILSNCSLDLRNHIEDLIEGIERAERNDDTIRKEALTDALASCLKAYKKREWEGKCKKDEWNF